MALPLSRIQFTPELLLPTWKNAAGWRAEAGGASFPEGDTPLPDRAGGYAMMQRGRYRTMAAFVTSRFMVIAGLLLSALPMLGASAPASAQIIPFTFGVGSLTDEDWNELNAANAKLLAGKAAVGTQGHWQNPTSGNSGTLEITGAFKRGDLPCRSVKYVFKLQGQPKPQPYLMNECKVADGSWKFV